jgi:lipoprotein-anchoring transpeptidase ErfK/SrfK
MPIKRHIDDSTAPLLPRRVTQLTTLQVRSKTAAPGTSAINTGLHQRTVLPHPVRGCRVKGSAGKCRVVVVYDPDTSRGTLYLLFKQGDAESVVLKGDVVVGEKGVTPTGTFTASHWEKDHTSTKYGWQADTPWSKSKLGANAFGPYQLHIKELEKRGIWIHGTMGPGFFGSSEFNRLVSPTSHGCVRCSNPTIFRLHELMPEPEGNRITISTKPTDAPNQ